MERKPNPLPPAEFAITLRGGLSHPSVEFGFEVGSLYATDKVYTSRKSEEVRVER